MWQHVIAMGTNKLNNHGDLKHRSLGWFIHMVTHIYICMDVHLYPSGQQCQNHHHCVWEYVLGCAHACKCVHMDLGVNLRCHSLGVFCLTFWGIIGTWDSLGWLSGKCQGSFCLPLLSAGIKRAHCHVWLSSMDLGSAQLLRRQSLHTEWQPGPSSIWIPVTHTFPLPGPFLFLASFPPISFCLCLL